MRILLLLWFVPLFLFWGWYGLSYYDISFGILMFTREVHDLVFQIYGNTLGIAPEKIPAMAAWACVVDSIIVLAIAAFRWRKKWYPQTKAMVQDLFRSYWNDDVRDDFAPIEERVAGQVRPAE